MHLLISASRNHVFQRAELLVHLRSASPLNQAVRSLSCNLTPCCAGGARLFSLASRCAGWAGQLRLACILALLWGRVHWHVILRLGLGLHLNDLARPRGWWGKGEIFLGLLPTRGSTVTTRRMLESGRLWGDWGSRVVGGARRSRHGGAFTAGAAHGRWRQREGHLERGPARLLLGHDVRRGRWRWG